MTQGGIPIYVKQFAGREQQVIADQAVNSPASNSSLHAPAGSQVHGNIDSAGSIQSGPDEPGMLPCTQPSRNSWMLDGT